MKPNGMDEIKCTSSALFKWIDFHMWSKYFMHYFDRTRARAPTNQLINRPTTLVFMLFIKNVHFCDGQKEWAVVVWFHCSIRNFWPHFTYLEIKQLKRNKTSRENVFVVTLVNQKLLFWSNHSQWLLTIHLISFFYPNNYQLFGVFVQFRAKKSSYIRLTFIIAI